MYAVDNEYGGINMVRVIGQDKNSFLYVTCRNCAAELEYTPHEVKKEWISDYGGALL